MRKILIAAICVATLSLLSEISSADIVYTTTNGNLGLIKIEGPQSLDLAGVQYVTGLQNPIVGSYWDNGASTLLLVTQDDSSNDKALKFNSSNLTTPVNSDPIPLTGAKAVTKILSTTTGEGMYFVYASSFQEFKTDDFTPTARQYTYSEDVNIKIKDATIIGQNIFVLVDDFVLKFDGQLNETPKNFSKWSVAQGSEVISYVAGPALVIGHENGIQLLASPPTDFLTTAAPVKAICDDAGSGFYYITQKSSGDVYLNELRHYTGATTNEVVNIQSNSAMVKLVRDSNYNVLVAIMDEKIRVYNTEDDNAFIAEYDSAALGGIPYTLAISTSTGYKNEKSGSCNLSGLGMLLILCFALTKLNHSLKS